MFKNYANWTYSFASLEVLLIGFKTTKIVVVYSGYVFVICRQKKITIRLL